MRDGYTIMTMDNTLSPGRDLGDGLLSTRAWSLRTLAFVAVGAVFIVRLVWVAVKRALEYRVSENPRRCSVSPN